jgi:hypothetical protein
MNKMFGELGQKFAPEADNEDDTPTFFYSKTPISSWPAFFFSSANMAAYDHSKVTHFIGLSSSFTIQQR